MMSCDYNGWADVPEEEREAIDVFEASTVQHSSVWVRLLGKGRSAETEMRREESVRSSGLKRRAAA
jgi:hypothetical protein